MVVREEVAGRLTRGGPPCVIRDGFLVGGWGATSSVWSSRAGSGGFVDLEQGMGCCRGELDGSQGLRLAGCCESGSWLFFIWTPR